MEWFAPDVVRVWWGGRVWWNGGGLSFGGGGGGGVTLRSRGVWCLVSGGMIRTIRRLLLAAL